MKLKQFIFASMAMLWSFVSPILAENVAKIGETGYVTLAEAVAAAQANETITLIADVELAEVVTIPADKTLNIDLNGKAISMQESIITTAYAFNNLGNLTITDGVGGGSINARGIYNGYGNGGDNVATATITVLGGTFNAKGTNGGAAIFNYGTAKVNGGKFTSIGGYSLNNQAGANMNIADGVEVTGGIYNNQDAELTVNGGNISNNRSGCHTIYAWNAKVTVNGGSIHNENSSNATILSAGTSEVTINGGTISIKDGRVPGNNNTWTSCLTDVANTAQIIVNDGTFNGGFRVQAGTTMTINGGSFNDVYGSNYNIYGTVTVTGGTFTDGTAKDFATKYVAEGYVALPDLSGNFVVGTQPTATVNNLGMTTVAAGDYAIWNGSFDSNTEDNGDMPLSFVMQFLADQDAEDMTASPYADWYGDFVLTFTGIESGSFTADGCYLAGHYGSYGWVKVPVDGMTIEDGVHYPVMLGVGLGQKYDYICSSVEDFRCALYLTPEILAANPNIQVKLELGLVDNSQGSDEAASALINNKNVYSVTEYTYDADDFKVDDLKGTLPGNGTEASPYLIQSADDLVLFRNSVNNGETTYSAPGVYVALGADIDMTGVNWVGIGSATADHGFMGNFDGKTFKIKNLTIDNPALDTDGYAYAGLFSVTEGIDKDNQNTIKNLIIENVTINTTGHIVSAAIAYPYYTIVDNVKVCGNIAITGGDYTAGVLAYTRRCVNASNLSIEGNEGSSVTGNQVVGGVISDIQMNGGLIADYSNFSAQGITVTGKKMVGGISGIIATQTLDGATVKNVVLNSEDDFAGLVAGRLGGTSTISGVDTDNVTGATAVVGATYDGAMPIEAKIGDTYYATVDAAMNATGDDAVTLLTEFTLDDSKEYTFTKNVQGKVTYTRTLPLVNFWMPLYVPFALPMSAEFLEKYDVAYFYDVTVESEGYQDAKKTTIALMQVTNPNAVLKANYPLVIRAKSDEAQNLELTFTDAKLQPAVEKGVTFTSVDQTYEVKGTYKTHSSLEKNQRILGMDENGKANWGTLAEGYSLNPYRLILTITSREDADLPFQTIGMRIVGEDGITFINEVNQSVHEGDDVIYDLQGRRVVNPVKGGIYIVNGKKVYFNK